MSKINEKQKAFCLEYVKNGCNCLGAYKKVYKSNNQGNARRLLMKDYVQDYIKEIQKQVNLQAIKDNDNKVSPKKIATIEDRKAFLTHMMLEDKEASRNDRLKALDILNKMDSAYVEKVEVKQVNTEWDIED